jgi:hypothetical protein
LGKHVQQTTIGDLINLQTTDKSNIVAAINEVQASAGKTKVNSYVWTATANQTLFTIPTGNYVPNKGNIEIHVGGKALISGIDYTETSPTSFTLLTISDLEAGDIVYAKWFEQVNLVAGSTVVEDVLTSSSNANALSANQGKVLNNKIGILSNLNTTAKTDVVSAINEVNSRVQTKVNQQSWTAATGQTIFNLVGGNYVTGKGNIQVFIGGIALVSGVDYTETSSTSFTLTNTDLDGEIVFAKWFENVTVVATQPSKVNAQSWIATSNQTVFTLTNGAYTPGKAAIEVHVAGATLISGVDYTETSGNSFTVNISDLNGEVVYAKWFEDVSLVAGATTIEDVLTSTSTSNALSANQGRLLNSQLSDIAISVKSYGAKGDGITDDTVSIQNAINQNAPKYSNIIIPDGSYKLTAPLILKTGTRLIMSKNTKLLRYHKDCLFQNGTTGDTQGQSNIVVSGGQLDLRGHILNGTSDDGSGFALGYAKDITIRDVDIYNVYFSHGMELCALENVLVERCGFYGFILDTGGTRTIAEAIQIERGTTPGFPYFGANDNSICKNVKIRDCKFGASSNATSWNVGIGTHQGDTVISADGVEIIGCISVDPLLAKIAQFKGYKNVTFERNNFTAPHGLEIYDDGATQTKVRLLNNKINSTGFEGIFLNGVDGLTSDGNTINGYTNAVAITNSCKNIKLGASDDYSAQTSDAVNAQSSSNYIIVNGVTIRKSGRHAFNFFGGCSHFKIINCMILDVADTGNAFNFAGSNTKIGHVRANHVVDAVMVNVVAATTGMDRLFFNDNFYAASITTPINSTATNSDTTGNHTF